MASQLYYYCLMLAALAAGIYNYTTSSSGNNLLCWSNQTMTYDEYKTLNQSLNLSVIAAPADPNTKYDMLTSGGNSLKLFQLVLAFAYGAVLIFTFLLAIITSFLSNQVPEDFLKMGGCKICLAMFCKILPPFIVIIHWIILILIAINLLFVLQGTCKVTSSSVAGVLVSADAYFSGSKICIIVTAAIWILLHYVGAILKDISYVEPFMYSPKTEGSNGFLHIMLKKLGP